MTEVIARYGGVGDTTSVASKRRRSWAFTEQNLSPPFFSSFLFFSFLFSSLPRSRSLFPFYLLSPFLFSVCTPSRELLHFFYLFFYLFFYYLFLFCFFFFLSFTHSSSSSSSSRRTRSRLLQREVHEQNEDLQAKSSFYFPSERLDRWTTRTARPARRGFAISAPPRGRRIPRHRVRMRTSTRLQTTTDDDDDDDRRRRRRRPTTATRRRRPIGVTLETNVSWLFLAIYYGVSGDRRRRRR